MKNTSKILTIGCALAVSAAPVSSQAASGKTRLKACADALVEQVAQQRDISTDYHLDARSRTAVIGARLGSNETFYLDARSSQTKEVVARYDCVVDGNAEVLSLTALPVSADDARKRANAVD